MRKGRKITGHLYPRGKIWWVKWQARGEVYRQSTEKTIKSEAEEAAEHILSPFKAAEEADTQAAVLARMNRAQTVAQKAAELANRIPLADVWTRFPYDHSQPKRPGGPIRELTPRNIEENKCAWEKFFDWICEAHKEIKAMQDVTPEVAQEYSNHLYKREKLTATRHNKLITTCNVMYRLAGVTSPFTNVTKYEIGGHEHREPFAVEQVQKLITTAEGEMRGFLAVLYFTGLRAGDAVQLRHENRRNGKIVLKTAKTRTDIDILEHPLLTAILNDICGEKSKGLLFPKLAEAYMKNHTILAGRFQRLMKKAFGKDFERTEARKGRGKLAVSRYGLHSFRHCLATHCALAGVPIGIVQKWLGHASAEITRIYQHYSTADQQQVIKAIPMLSLPGLTEKVIEAEVTEIVEDKPDELKALEKQITETENRTQAIRKLVVGLTQNNAVATRKKLLKLIDAKKK